MITYNHEKFIAQAIEGVMMQKTNFDYKLIIGEDCSTDKTREICIEYQNKFPDKIQLILNEQNIGMLPNFIDVLQNAKGKYIAILEGDDYWTDPYKLQKQVDFLEANPEYVLCHHDAVFLYEENSEVSKDRLVNFDFEYDNDTKDLLIENRVSTLTAMFRNNLIGDFPEWFFNAFTGDWPLWILLSQFGKLKYLPFTGAVYRVHENGITAQKREKNLVKRRENIIKINNGFIVLYYEYLNIFPEHTDVINQQIKHYNKLNFLYYFALRNLKKAKELIKTKKISFREMKTTKDKIKFFIVQLLSLV